MVKDLLILEVEISLEMLVLIGLQLEPSDCGRVSSRLRGLPTSIICGMTEVMPLNGYVLEMSWGIPRVIIQSAGYSTTG